MHLHLWTQKILKTSSRFVNNCQWTHVEIVTMCHSDIPWDQISCKWNLQKKFMMFVKATLLSGSHVKWHVHRSLHALSALRLNQFVRECIGTIIRQNGVPRVYHIVCYVARIAFDVILCVYLYGVKMGLNSHVKISRESWQGIVPVTKHKLMSESMVLYLLTQ